MNIQLDYFYEYGLAPSVITTEDDGEVMCQTELFPNGEKMRSWCAIGRSSPWPVRRWTTRSVPSDSYLENRDDNYNTYLDSIGHHS